MASKKVKGITVEIGGNTTKLGKAIEESEKKTRSLQTELKGVEKLLKFDPKNTELLAQKQKLLKDAISETAQKLKTLEDAQAQVTEQFKKGDIGEDVYRDFQREIVNTKKNLTSMENELKASNKGFSSYGDMVDDATKELDEFKDKASEAFDAVKTGSIVLGGAMLAGAGYALNLSTEFDQAFNTLITKTGASKDEFDSLNESMENIYKNNFGESIEDVAESMATTRNNTKLTGEELEKTTEYALLMRDVFEFDVNESTRTAKMMMDQFGISSEEAYNLIAQGAQSGLDKNGDLLDTINEYSVHFSQLGIDAPTMFNMLVNGAESGTFSVDKLGDAVKEFGIRVKDESSSTQEAFKAIGLDSDAMAQKFGKGGESAKKALNETVTALFNMKDPIAQNQAGVALFGTMWEDLGADGVKALMDVSGEIDITKDKLGEINEMKYDDIGSALEGLGRTIQTDVISPLGEELQPVVEEVIDYVKENGPEIKDFLSKVVESVGDFVGFVVDNGDVIVSTIVGVGTGFAMWKVASMINGVVGAVKAFQIANEGASVAQALLNGVMNANPFILVASLIAMVVAGIVTFIATNDNARQKVVEIWNKIRNAFKTGLEAVKNLVSSIGKAIANFFTQTIPNAINKTVTFFKSLPEKIRNAISSMVEKVKNVFNNVKTSATNIASNTVTSAVNFFKTLPSKIRSAINGAISNVSSWGSNLKSTAKSKISAMVSTVTSTAKQIPSKVKNAIKGAISNVSSWGSSMKSKAKSAMSGVVTSIKNTLGKAVSSVKSVGKNIVEGLWNGINNKVSWITNKLKGFKDSVMKSLKSFFGIKSPSRVMKAEVGEHLATGLAEGLTDSSAPTDAVKQVGEDILKSAESINGVTLNRQLNTTFRGSVTTDASILDKLEAISKKLDAKTQIVLDTGALVGETVSEYDKALANRKTQLARGW